VEPRPTIRRRGRKTHVLLAGILLLGALYSGPRAASQNQADQPPDPSEPLVIQGRITAIRGTHVMVKLPDGYPGEQGVHAQFVTAGPIFRVDVAHARVLLPDGKQTDKLPLAIGDHVLMVLTRSSASSTEPGGARPTYSASLVERIVQGDRVITH